MGNMCQNLLFHSIPLNQIALSMILLIHKQNSKSYQVVPFNYLNVGSFDLSIFVF